jgi:hypothetical protein
MQFPARQGNLIKSTEMEEVQAHMGLGSVGHTVILFYIVSYRIRKSYLKVQKGRRTGSNTHVDTNMPYPKIASSLFLFTNQI